MRNLSSPFIQRINSLPKFPRKIILALMWFSPFIFFNSLMSSFSALWTAYFGQLASKWTTAAEILRTKPFSLIDNSSYLLEILDSRNVSNLLLLVGGLIILTNIMFSIVVFRWHFKGPPENQKKAIKIFLNPILYILIYVIFLSITLYSVPYDQAILLVNSDQAFIDLFKILDIYNTQSDVINSMIAGIIWMIFWTFLAVKGNKKALH